MYAICIAPQAQPEQSYSERQLYEAALDRMARELAAVEQIDEASAVAKIDDVLRKTARHNKMTAEADARTRAAEGRDDWSQAVSRHRSADFGADASG